MDYKLFLSILLVATSALGQVQSLKTDNVGNLLNPAGIKIPTGVLLRTTDAPTNNLNVANKLYVDGASGVTPAALTRTNDTNVTLTLGGTPATALLQATSITAGWSGTLAKARGGFGADVSSVSAHTFFANNTGSSGAPSFTSFVAKTDYWDTTDFAGSTHGLVPEPLGVPSCDRFLDETGSWTCAAGGSSDAAPKDAHYVTTQAESGLSAEFNLGSLTTGLLKVSVTTGVATPSTITDNSSNWDTAYTERLEWDGGTTNLVAATGRTSLGLGNAALDTESALTKTDDTNVTLSLGGAPTTALLHAASITVGWTGTLAVSRGGTNAATFAAHSYFGNNTGSTAAPAPHVIDYTELSGTPTAITPAALTKVDDTNVTLTLGGTPSTALLQASSITAGWTGTLAVSRGGTGAGTLTGLVLGNGTSAMTAVTAPSGTVVGTTDTQTLTNKWVQPRTTATPAPGATPAVNTDNFDLVSFTSLGTAITSMTTSLTGTPVRGQRLMLGFKDDGTARGITWGASFQNGPATLLATTVISKQHWVGLIYDGTKWTCFAVDATGY